VVDTKVGVGRNVVHERLGVVNVELAKRATPSAALAAT